MSITDAQFAAMLPHERRELIRRLARVTAIDTSTRRVRRMRRRRLLVNAAAPVVLIPWIVYLATSLPDHYVAQHWATAWVGFDVLLLVMFAVTAVLGLLRRQLLLLTAFGTGLLLICDAWFDVMTASSGDRWQAVASAVFVELPVAALLMSGALRLMRASALRFWLLEPGQPLWRVPLVMGDQAGPA